MITIVSKEKERVQFQTKIIEFARGLEQYNHEEDVVFEEIITSDFLNSFKEFYEGNEYNIENLTIKDPNIKSKDIKFLNAKNLAIMTPYFAKAQKNRSILPFVELIQGADLFRAPLFKDLVSVTIATLLYCTQKDEFEIQKYREFWGLSDKESALPSYDQSSPFYSQYVTKLQQNYQKKLDAIFDATEEAKTTEDQTLAQKIQEQINQGLVFEDDA